MKPILFSVGNIHIYTHGLFLVVAMAVSSIILWLISSRDKSKKELIFDLVVFSLIVGLIAARLCYFFLYRDQFYTFTDVVKIWEGGLVSWAGFVAGVLTYLLILKIYREPFMPWLDNLSIVALFGLSIGRLGSFLSGEMAGKSTNLLLNIHGMHPVTLYESSILLIIFIIFLILKKRNKISQQGVSFVLVVAIYGIIRFGLDFLRTDKIYYYGLTLTQIISTFVIFFAVIYLVFLIVKIKRGETNARFQSY